MRHKSHPLPSVADTSLDTEADLREETDGTNVKQRPGVTEYFADCIGRVWYLWMSVGMSATYAASGPCEKLEKICEIEDLRLASH